MKIFTLLKTWINSDDRSVKEFANLPQFDYYPGPARYQAINRELHFQFSLLENAAASFGINMVPAALTNSEKRKMVLDNKPMLKKLIAEVESRLGDDNVIEVIIGKFSEKLYYGNEYQERLRFYNIFKLYDFGFGEDYLPWKLTMGQLVYIVTDPKFRTTAGGIRGIGSDRVDMFIQHVKSISIPPTIDNQIQNLEYEAQTTVAATITIRVKAKSKEEAQRIINEGNLSHENIISSEVDLFDAVTPVDIHQIKKSK